MTTTNRVQPSKEISKGKKIQRTCAQHGDYVTYNMKLFNLEREMPCPMCAEISKNKKTEALKIAQTTMINERLENLAIAPQYNIRYKDLIITEENKNVLSRNRKIIHAISQGEYHNLIYLGNIGAGKTQLLTTSAIELTRLGLRVKIVEGRRLAREIEERYISRKETDKIMQPYLHCDILMIDELRELNLNKEKAKNEQELYFEIIDYRCKHKKPTFLASNFDQEAIRTIVDDQAIDRIFQNGNLFKFTWDSFRK